MCPEKVADVCFWTLSRSPSVRLDPVWPSAIARERSCVLSALLMLTLWRHSCRSPVTKYSESSRFTIIDICLIHIIFSAVHFRGVQYIMEMHCHFQFFSLQILPEVPHLRLSTGGTEHPVHSAVVPQQSQRRLSERPVEEPQSWAAGNLWPKTNKPTNQQMLVAHRATKALFVLSGRAVGGRPLFGVPSVRPSAVEQSAAEAAGLQPGEQERTRTNLMGKKRHKSDSWKKLACFSLYPVLVLTV